MQTRTITVVALAVGLSVTAASARAQDPLGAFAGEWRASGEGEALARTIVVDAKGFALTTRSAGGEPETRRYTPTAASPDVFEFVPERGGLLSRMMASERGSPFDGDDLTWARRADGALVVYSLAIDPKGRFTLDRHEHRLEPGGLRVALQRLQLGVEQTRVEALLTQGTP